MFDRAVAALFKLSILDPRVVSGSQLSSGGTKVARLNAPFCYSNDAVNRAFQILPIRTKISSTMTSNASPPEGP